MGTVICFHCSDMVGRTILSSGFFIIILIFQCKVRVVEAAPTNGQPGGYLPPPLCEKVVKEVEKEVEEDECKIMKIENCKDTVEQACEDITAEKCETVKENKCVTILEEVCKAVDEQECS